MHFARNTRPTHSRPASSAHKASFASARAATLTALLGATLAISAAASPAHAHDPVIASTPTAGDVIAAIPERFSVSTDQPMLDLSGVGAGFGLQVTDSSGLFYGDGCLSIDGPTLSMPATLGQADEYTLTYQYVSSDGHTLSDRFTFRYEPANATNAAVGLDTPPVCGQAAPENTIAPSAEPGAEPSAAPLATETETAEPAGSAEADGPSAALGVLIAIAVAVVVALGLAALAWSRRRRTATTR